MLVSRRPSDLFQHIFMADWTLPVPKVLHVRPAVSLHSCYLIIRVNVAVPDEFPTQHHGVLSHVQLNVNANV